MAFFASSTGGVGTVQSFNLTTRSPHRHNYCSQRYGKSHAHHSMGHNGLAFTTDDGRFYRLGGNFVHSLNFVGSSVRMFGRSYSCDITGGRKGSFASAVSTFLPLCQPTAPRQLQGLNRRAPRSRSIPIRHHIDRNVRLLFSLRWHPDAHLFDEPFLKCLTCL